MRINYPDYYKKFSCSGASCPDTCCGGWKITVDEKTCREYRKEKGEFGKRLRDAIDFRNNCFKMVRGKCPMLNEQGLCDIHLHLGEGRLCDTCRNYPRHTEIYGNLMEVSLSLSCPEAARLILENPDHFGFTEKEKEDEVDGKARGKFLLFEKLPFMSKKGNDNDRIDEEFLDMLRRARKAMFAILSDRSQRLEVRLAMVLAMAHDIQSRIDRKRIDLINDVLNRYQADGAFERFERKAAVFEGRLREKQQYMVRVGDMLEGLERITDKWPRQLKSYRRFVGGRSDSYEEAHEKFSHYYKDRVHEYEHLMIYFLYVYMLGAVYDEDVFSKVKFAVASCLIMAELAAAALKQKGKITMEDQIDIVHIFSRETEHSDFNLESLEYVFRQSELFQLEKMMVCIMNP